MPYPDPRTIRRALGVLERLPPEALADLTERLIDRLDAAEPDPDVEPEEDACEAGECGGVHLWPDNGAGEPDDAEVDDEDRGAGEDEPEFPYYLRPETDGLVTVRRKVRVVRISRSGRRRPMFIWWEWVR